MHLHIDNVTKKYGSLVALDHISLSLHEGIYGLLGPNGAGKSTLMNILTGNLKADSGFVTLDDKPFKCQNYSIGYMPQSETFFPFFRGLEYLQYIALLKDMRKDNIKSECEMLLKKVDLWDVRHQKISAYSGGMKRRIMLAAALLNHPDIIILDEPTTGMDPEQRIAVRNLIGEFAINSIVILSTHVVSDVEYIASNIILLDHGHILFQEKPFDLKKHIQKKVYFVHIKEAELPKLKKQYLIASLSKEDDGILVKIIADEKPPFPCEETTPSLEDVYQSLLGEKV